MKFWARKGGTTSCPFLRPQKYLCENGGVFWPLASLFFSLFLLSRRGGQKKSCFIGFLPSPFLQSSNNIHQQPPEQKNEKGNFCHPLFEKPVFGPKVPESDENSAPSAYWPYYIYIYICFSLLPLVLYRVFDSCLVLPCWKRFSPSSSTSSLSSLSLSFLYLSGGGGGLPKGFSNAFLALLLSPFASDPPPYLSFKCDTNPQTPKKTLDKGSWSGHWRCTRPSESFIKSCHYTSKHKSDAIDFWGAGRGCCWASPPIRIQTKTWFVMPCHTLYSWMLARLFWCGYQLQEDMSSRAKQSIIIIIITQPEGTPQPQNQRDG